MLLNPTIKRIASKELTLFFSSPIAYLFLITFAAISLFVFFWVESFFARNIADIRPLFEWMPLLLIFLSSTLTMRMWSEERRTGTLEHVLTQPLPLWYFVIGKFAACKILLFIALLVTLPLPITISFIAELDWGPVISGYLAAMLLGSAYISVGLFVSSRSDNQIVAFICSAIACVILYVIGLPLVTKFFGNAMGETLRLLGTGSRFDSITRGVIDFRDFYYFISIIIVFLALNALSLEKERWASTGDSQHHSGWRAVVALILLNALGANIWLGQLSSLRMDTTEGNQYSVSETTENYVNQLREPLLLRGYFSSKTHPLLAPLVPQLRDLLKEYEVLGGKRVKVEFIDPVTEPDLEEEANQKYGIRPTPFQVEDRYQASLVNSYFNILVKYGDEFEVLGFRDLIDVKQRGVGDIDVRLRNPEYDITRSIKKVLLSYQSGGNLFDTVEGKISFTGFISDNARLPEQLQQFKSIVENTLDDYKSQAKGRLSISFIDPEANGGDVARRIQEEYGFSPMATSLFSDESFYFYLTLQKGDQIIQLPLGNVDEESFKQSIEAGIKRFATGFTKTVALVTPPAPPQMHPQFGMPPQNDFSMIQHYLSSDLNVQTEDLSDGEVASEADILILVSPRDLDEKALFAVDQFLMKGGTVVAATSPYSARFDPRSINLENVNSGIASWLENYGLTLDQQLVLDPQNTAFPVPIQRNVGGFMVQEMRMLDYPYFIDVRGDGINEELGIAADIPQLMLAWASPITIDEDKNAERSVATLLTSSDGSWLSASNDIMPRLDNDGLSTFDPEGEQKSHKLAVVVEGQFSSYFADKSNPLLKQEQPDDSANAEQAQEGQEEEQAEFNVSGIIKKSSSSARIILIASNDFLNDRILQMASSSSGSDYLNTRQLVANAVEWSLEDRGLLSIRARGQFNRTLPPMEQDSRLFLEYFNYFLALLAIGVIALVYRQMQLKKQRRYATYAA